MTSNLLGNDDWAGICNVPRLYTIAVAYNSFSLIFPSCLATTPTLNYLDVSNNNVFGPVTDPLGTYTNLTTLKAAHCSLNGTVPMSIGGLKKLQLLDMSNNRLSGVAFLWVSQLSNLVEVQLGHNSFTGTLANNFFLYLPRLEILNLEANALSGNIPEYLGPNLFKKLDLSGNQITGTLSAAIANLTELQYFDLSRNALTGEIPVAFSNLASLTEVDLSYNQLDSIHSGVFDGSIKDVLQTLEIVGNSISAIPDNVKNLAKLTTFRAATNKLTYFPTDLTGMASLRNFDISYNSLTSFNLATLSTLVKLESIYLDHNQIGTANFTALASLPNLLILSMTSCGLTVLPTTKEILALPKLNSLRLSGNTFGGVFPQYFYLLRNLEVLTLRSCGFVGRAGGLPPTLEVLDISSNSLTGISLFENGGLCELVELYASKNMLDGGFDFQNELTKYCGGRSDLAILDFSLNSLDGLYHIPSSIRSLNIRNNSMVLDMALSIEPLKGLVFLDMSNNLATGSLSVLTTLSKLIFLDVMGNANVKAEKVSDFSADQSCTMVGKTAIANNYPLDSGFLTYSESMTHYVTYLCPDVAGTSGTMVHVSPSYYGYCSCQCASGYAGQPPNCEGCGGGSYAPDSGRTACLSCPPGSMSSGNVAHATCMTCLPGTYAASHASTSCSNCPAGTFSSLAGATSCLPCADRSITNEPGKTACTSCPGNTYTTAGDATTCYLCEFGFVVDNRCVLYLPLLICLILTLLLVALIVTVVVVMLAVGLPVIVPRVRHAIKAKRMMQLTALYTKLSEGSISPDLLLQYSDIKVDGELGSGAYGRVFRATWRGTLVAVKELTGISSAEEILQEFREEVMVMSKLRHPNVIILVGACTEPPNLCIVMEYMARGSLAGIVRDHSNQYGMIQILEWAHDICCGMHYLHQRSILHRDLKALNVLVDHKDTAKISDFGISSIMDKGKNSFQTEGVGSIPWVAPEVLRHETVGTAADVYSFGITLWEVVSRQELYAGMKQSDIIVRVLQSNMRPRIPPDCSYALSVIISDCWNSRAASRPSFQTLTFRIEELLHQLGAAPVDVDLETRGLLQEKSNPLHSAMMVSASPRVSFNSVYLSSSRKSSTDLNTVATSRL